MDARLLRKIEEYVAQGCPGGHLIPDADARADEVSGVVTLDGVRYAFDGAYRWNSDGWIRLEVEPLFVSDTPCPCRMAEPVVPCDACKAERAS